MSLYTDRGSHYFRNHQGRRDRPRLTDPGGKGAGAARGRAYRGFLTAQPVERRASFPTPFARGRSERASQTLQDRPGLDPGIRLAGITTAEAANTFIREVYLPAHNARFAVDPAGEGSAFTPIPGVNLDEILCVQEERQVMNDNCVSYRTLKLQIPESPMRPHFVKARVKVHVYPDGSHAVFHGPRCIGRYDQNGAIRDAKNVA